ncbi:DUF3291 domain-containing protein [Pseudaestuariivita atlantica]|nr:DUF3291 domain-containing protein [Pseudaestuariivita atlantica]
MNWGRMTHPLTHPDMSELASSLDAVYRAAEQHPGFIWRVPDEDAARQLAALGHDPQISATVSVWTDLETLRSYTFSGAHGAFLARAREWFDVVEGPQLVIWDVRADHRPTFADAFDRLAHLRDHGPSPCGRGWDG